MMRWIGHALQLTGKAQLTHAAMLAEDAGNYNGLRRWWYNNKGDILSMVLGNYKENLLVK